jgi:hypothetical protein
VSGGATAFEVLDALGLARLDRRSPDLDGAVPLRVAQACSPLLEGNAFGFQIVLTRPIEVQRKLGRLVVGIAEPHREALAAAHRAAIPRLLAQGFLRRGGAWHEALAKGFVETTRPLRGPSRVRLWTGLFVRPDPGVWLRVSSSANRRNRLIEVTERWIPDEGALVPVLLDITVSDDAPDRVLLSGEVATIAPMSPRLAVEDADLADARELGEAHVAFYDAAYFAAKKGDPTRKYRKLKPPPAADDDGPARCRVVRAGPAGHAITTSAHIHGAEGPRTSESAVPRIVFDNQVAFEARFDGHTLTIEPDKRALDRGARAVEEAFTAVFGPSFIEEHRGALWYLTKYFTPHPPGEPHFFVKPWAFVQTPPGWSSLLEGIHGDGFDVLRGVVSTDVFHATPAVFHVGRIGAPIRVAEGTPLLQVIPVPRQIRDAGYREARWLDG